MRRGRGATEPHAWCNAMARPTPAGGEARSERGNRSGDEGAEQENSYGNAHGRTWVSSAYAAGAR